jgi:hypothetical protein
VRQLTTVDKVSRILHVLSAFEESSAECIQQMLIDFSNQSYQHGVVQAEKFICHIEALFLALDKIEIRLNRFEDSLGLNMVFRGFELIQLGQGTKTSSQKDRRILYKAVAGKGS